MLIHLKFLKFELIWFAFIALLLSTYSKSWNFLSILNLKWNFIVANKTIKINNLPFKVERHIPRCVAINLKPKTDDNSLNLLQSLKKNYNHFDMGIYLRSLNDGKVIVGDKILVDK